MPDGEGFYSIIILVVILTIWSSIWKGLAMWKACRQNSKSWFIILLLINTLGILDIIYYYLVNKKEAEPISYPEIPN